MASVVMALARSGDEPRLAEMEPPSIAVEAIDSAG